MTFLGITSLVAFILAIGVWFKTKRIGPVVAVLIGAAVVITAKNTAVLQAMSNAVGSIFTSIANAVPGLIGG